METLANRVAYSLGTSPQSREHLVHTLRSFYDTRSAVVHSGATRLAGEQERDHGDHRGEHQQLDTKRQNHLPFGEAARLSC